MIDTSRRLRFTKVSRSLALPALLVSVAVTLSFAVADLGLPFVADDSSAVGKDASSSLGALHLVVPTIRYGLEMERYGDFEEVEVTAGRRLLRDLRDAGVSRDLSHRLARAAVQDRPGLRQLPAHRRVLVHDHTGLPTQLIIELGELEFLRFDLAAETVAFEDADGISREFATMALFYTGDVDSMLAETELMPDLEEVVRRALTEEMPLNPAFRIGLIKLIYTAKRDELGVTRGYGAVEALRYGLGEQRQTAYRFCDADLDVEGFFRPDGTPAVQTWLTSPVANGHVSSPYNLRRKHPVLQMIRPHHGTDYAARHGEPVLALSDGIVVARDRKLTNGNYVKLEHNGTYSTQYLHLKGFAAGLRPGQRVRKGEVIGYVGSTGLSSGPHVCLRFWKHGRQVDFQRELRRLPTTSSLGSASMVAFEQRQATLGELLEPET